MEQCIFHGTHYRPHVCKRCSHITGTQLEQAIELDEEYQRLERVVSICRHTGRERISFRRKDKHEAR